MTLRSCLRDEFPARWWMSSRWWIDSFRSAGLQVMACMATVALIGRVLRVMRPRNDPAVLGKIGGEAYVFGLVYNISVCAVIVRYLGDNLSRWILIGDIAYCAANAVMALTVVTVLVRSRLHEVMWWSMRDFVEDHGVVNRPPETIREYEAEQMRRVVFDGD